MFIYSFSRSIFYIVFTLKSIHNIMVCLYYKYLYIFLFLLTMNLYCIGKLIYICKFNINLGKVYFFCWFLYDYVVHILD